MQGRLSALALALVVVSCGDEVSVSRHQAAVTVEIDPTLARDIVFVLDGGRSQGTDCAPILPAPFATPTDWDCRDREIGWEKQKRGLVEALRKYAPVDGSMTVTVVVNSFGMLRNAGTADESLDGPFVPAGLSQVAITSRDTLDFVIDLVLALPVPLVRGMQCTPGYPRDENRCTPLASDAWGLSSASAVLNEPSAAGLGRPEVCLATTRSERIIPPPALRDFPERLFPGVAWAES